ncbi:hypothetical protein LEP3755_52720 [Leptolyngbya sp. NIES-3755]|nr:hypothetical protein LEP3755_52720 [Leptolyngbya sp. NIES-3755]
MESKCDRISGIMCWFSLVRSRLCLLKFDYQATGIFMALAPILSKSYIEQRGTAYWIEGTRISLDSVVYSFLNGDSPESIAQNFPLLSLEQVYGAIAFYLANRSLIDAYLQEGEAEFERLQQTCREKSPLLYQKLKAAQAQKQ